MSKLWQLPKIHCADGKGDGPVKKRESKLKLIIPSKLAEHRLGLVWGKRTFNSAIMGHGSCNSLVIP